MKRKSLSEKANDYANRSLAKERCDGYKAQWLMGYSWGAYEGFKAGYRAGKRGKK